MMLRTVFTIGTLILFLSHVTDATAQVRKYSNEFLTLGVGARALGMGNTSVASTNNTHAGYWNPAGLAHVDRFQVGAMHAEWFAGIAKYDYLSIALPISDGKRVLGLSAIRFGIDNIPNTLRIVEPDGSINYDNISVFSAADYGFLFSYAQKIKNLQIGGNVKLIRRTVGSFANAWGFGLDLGAQYRIKNLLLGLTIKDVTTTFNSWSFNFTQEEKELLAITDNVIPSSSVEQTGVSVIPAIAYKLEVGEKIGILTEANFVLTFDGERNTLIKSSSFSIDPRFGMEVSYGDFIFLRGGINNIQQFKNDVDGSTFTSIQPNVGVGLKIKEINIDYAFTGLNRVSDGVYSHVVSLLFSLKSKKQSQSY